MDAPKLRFKEFNDEWRKIKLTKLLNEFKEKSLGNENGIVLTSSRKGLFPRSKYFDGREEDNTLGYSLVPRKSFTYRHMSDDNTFFINLNRDFELGLVSPEYPVFTTNELLDTIYFANFINDSRSFKQYCQLQKKGGTRTRLYFKVLKELEITIPSIDEQKKIGLFFESLSKRIQLQQEKIDLLKEQKKGYMQKIFSQELRFKYVNGQAYPDWKEECLENLCDINTGNKDTQDKIENGKYPFFVRSQIVERINTYSYDGEAILTAGDGVGVGKVFHYINGKFDFHQRVYMISNFKNCIGKFIYYYFSSNFMKEAQKYNAKTSVDSVRREMLTKMVFPYPSVEEQKKIADFLSQLDSKIALEEQTLNTLQKQKQAFMQQMFI